MIFDTAPTGVLNRAGGRAGSESIGKALEIWFQAFHVRMTGPNIRSRKVQVFLFSRGGLGILNLKSKVN